MCVRVGSVKHTHLCVKNSHDRHDSCICRSRYFQHDSHKFISETVEFLELTPRVTALDILYMYKDIYMFTYIYIDTNV